ncbi:hypothetical protein J2Z50_003346 [Ensifer mexicanus]|nr:hypothetical protein [Sinorhizobium mexicanum]
MIDRLRPHQVGQAVRCEKGMPLPSPCTGSTAQTGTGLWEIISSGHVLERRGYV